MMKNILNTTKNPQIVDTRYARAWLISSSGSAIKREDAVRRIHRIKGQVEAVEKMIGEKQGCLETVQQIIAAKNALGSLAVEILCQESCKIDSKEKRKELMEKIIKEV